MIDFSNNPLGNGGMKSLAWAMSTKHELEYISKDINRFEVHTYR